MREGSSSSTPFAVRHWLIILLCPQPALPPVRHNGKAASIVCALHKNRNYSYSINVYTPYRYTDNNNINNNTEVWVFEKSTGAKSMDSPCEPRTPSKSTSYSSVNKIIITSSICIWLVWWILKKKIFFFYCAKKIIIKQKRHLISCKC